MHKNTLSTNCRRSVGGESPELAESLLQTGQYVPRSAQDMWSFGLVMLEVLGGQRPLEHNLLLLSDKFRDEVQTTGRSKTHLEYLARLPSEAVPYADQVGQQWGPPGILGYTLTVSCLCNTVDSSCWEYHSTDSAGWVYDMVALACADMLAWLHLVSDDGGDNGLDKA